MRRVAAGFTLLECMLYFVLVGVVVLLTFRQFVLLERSGASLLIKGEQLLALHAAGDLLWRDLHALSVDNKRNFYVGEKRLVWQIDDTSFCGWQQEGEKLYRYVGAYTARDNHWSGYNKSLVADGISLFAATCNKKGDSSLVYRITADRCEVSGKCGVSKSWSVQ